MNKEFSNLKKLGLDTQSFETLIAGDYLYVDKTKDILNLINNGRIYFLSRPRRFGKSLLVSTLKELFEGNKKLFKDLYIYDKWDWEETYPVINLNMSKPSKQSMELFEKTLSRYVLNIGKNLGINLDNDMPSGFNLSDLIEKLFNKTKKKGSNFS